MLQRRHALAVTAASAAWSLLLPACATPSAPPLRALRAADFRNSGQRGVGLGLLRFGGRSDADHDALVDLGATHVRMFVEAERAPGAVAYTVSEVQLRALDDVLVKLRQRGLYLVLVTSFGEDARGTLWGSAPLKSSVLQVWRMLAERTRGNTTLAGFDLVNEPVPPGMTFAQRENRWLEFASTLVQAIRAVDKTRVLLVESAPDATPESFENMHPLPYDDLVYSVHSYRPMEFTHQGLGEDKTARPYPELDARGYSSATTLAESLAHVQRFARRHDVPVYVGEFSASRWAPDGAAARYVADSVEHFNRNGWSWAYHEFRAWHGWDPEIASPDPQSRQRSQVAPVLRALRAGMRAPRS